MQEKNRFGEKFEFLEHTGDAYIAAYGQTMEEAFGNAALAMFEVMTDTRKIAQTQKEVVEVEAEDEYALLYSWLEALLVRFEVEGLLFSRFDVEDLKETSNGFQLKSIVFGEKYDAKKHPQKVGVKAITYHQMEIIKDVDKVTLMFILDI